MEVSSLTFVTGEPAGRRLDGMPVSPLKSPAAVRNCRLPTGKAAMADAHAPGVAIPLRFVITGVVSLFSALAWFALRPDLLVTYHYNQYIIAITHLFVLGWLCSASMGALYQLVPVALETRLYSERMAHWHFALHIVGFLGMVAMFWRWDMKQVGHFGSIFAFGVMFFGYNLARTLLRVPRWNVVAVGIASALFWLVATVFFGLFLASAKCWPQINPFDPIASMHAHAHLGVLGFFVMLLVAVSYKLIPMFTLSELQNPRRAVASVVLLNVGLLGLVVTILLGNPWKIAFAALVLSGLACFGAEMLAILSARRRRVLDWGLRQFLVSISLLVPLCMLAVVLSWPQLPLTALTAQLETAYGVLAVLGVVSFAIVGLLHKIIPFLVWYATYSSRIGRGQVPSLTEIYSERLQIASFGLLMSGLIGVIFSSALGLERMAQGSCMVLLLGAGVFAVNVLKILSHWFRPQLPRQDAAPATTGS